MESSAKTIDGVTITTTTFEPSDGFMRLTVYTPGIEVDAEKFALDMINSIDPPKTDSLGKVELLKMAYGSILVANRTIAGRPSEGLKLHATLLMFGVRVPVTEEVHAIVSKPVSIIAFSHAANKHLPRDAPGFDLIFGSLHLRTPPDAQGP